MWEDNMGWTFSLEEMLLWTHILARSDGLNLKKPLWWICLFQTQLFTSQDVNWWTGMVWITCGLLWCFYQLFGLSFWRHPFTAEDPLVSKWCDAKSYKSVTMKKQTHLHLEWLECKQIFWTFLIPLQRQNGLRKFYFFNLSKLLSNWPLLNKHCCLLP